MAYKKVLLELSISFCISYFIYSLVDLELFGITGWDQDRVVNLLHTWLTLISTYYIYNGCLKLAFDRWTNTASKRLVTVLFCVSLIAIAWVVATDLLFYWLYYDISSSLHEQTIFFEFDLPITVTVVMIGSLFFFQKYHVRPIPEEIISGVKDLEKLAVTKGKRQSFVDHQDIGLIYIESEIVMLQTLAGEKYYTQESLASIVDKLSSTSFFRLNRQVIASRAVIKAYEKLDFQKLQVVLNDSIDYHGPIVVSKYNASAFKKWLTNSL